MPMKIDFREIAGIVRYDMLPRMKMVTPQKFDEMSPTDNLELYRNAFNVYHDVCQYLSSALSVERFNEEYTQHTDQSNTFDPEDY